MARGRVHLVRPIDPVPAADRSAPRELRHRGVRRRARDHRQDRARDAPDGRAGGAHPLHPLHALRGSRGSGDPRDGCLGATTENLRCGQCAVTPWGGAAAARAGLRGPALGRHEQRGVPGLPDGFGGRRAADAGADVPNRLHAAVRGPELPHGDDASQPLRGRSARDGASGPRRRAVSRGAQGGAHGEGRRRAPLRRGGDQNAAGPRCPPPRRRRLPDGKGDLRGERAGHDPGHHHGAARPPRRGRQAHGAARVGHRPAVPAAPARADRGVRGPARGVAAGAEGARDHLRAGAATRAGLHLQARRHPGRRVPEPARPAPEGAAPRGRTCDRGAVRGSIGRPLRGARPPLRQR